MVLQDALFNWLQMKIVSDARPEDGAAKVRDSADRCGRARPDPRS